MVILDQRFLKKLLMKLESGRMYRQHTSSSYTIMISKPPRPPSWRDFVNVDNDLSPPKSGSSKIPVSSSPPTGSSSKPSRIPTVSTSVASPSKRKDSCGERPSRPDPEFSNLGRIQQKSYSEGSDLSRLGIGHGSSSKHHSSHQIHHGGPGHSHTLPNPHTSKSGSKRHHHRSQGRLHRTTSQYNIEQADIPRIEHMTMTLANTKLQKLKGYSFTGSSDMLDPLLYLDDNHKRCERWLKEVHACQPYEDISETKLHSPSSTTQSSGLILEEGLSETDLSAKSSLTPVDVCSGSGSDLDSVSVCAAHRLDVAEKEMGDHIQLGSGKGNKIQSSDSKQKISTSSDHHHRHHHHYNKHHHSHHHHYHRHHHNNNNSNTNNATTTSSPSKLSSSSNNKNSSSSSKRKDELNIRRSSKTSNMTTKKQYRSKSREDVESSSSSSLTLISPSLKSILDPLTKSSKENRDPSIASSSPEMMIQHRKNRKNLSDHSASSSSKGSVKYAGCEDDICCDPSKHIS